MLTNLASIKAIQTIFDSNNEQAKITVEACSMQLVDNVLEKHVPAKVTRGGMKRAIALAKLNDLASQLCDTVIDASLFGVSVDDIEAIITRLSLIIVEDE